MVANILIELGRIVFGIGLVSGMLMSGLSYQYKGKETTMSLLYDKTHIRTDTFTYKINSGGEFSIRESGIVTIVFENGRFVKAEFPFTGSYSRNGWRILSAINNEISQIESELAEKAEKQ